MRALLVFALLAASCAGCAHQQAHVYVTPPIFVPQKPEPPTGCFNCFNNDPFADPALKDT